MVKVLSLRRNLFILCLMVLTMTVGCTGRRITTAVENQQFQSGPSAATAVEAAKAAPPPGEEVRVTEQPVTPVAPSQAALPAAQTVPELSDVYFDFDQDAIRGEARSVLEANARFLMAQPHRDILIEGHCDERGTTAYNLVLGERRARVAKRYLQELGVAPSQIQITSYGKERPFCREHSEACWQSNRRAHFRRP